MATKRSTNRPHKHRSGAWAPTPENFGELAKTWSGNLQAATDSLKPTVWEDFVKNTVEYAHCQVIAYSYVDADTRAQWALENSKQHTDYVHWQQLITKYTE